MDSHNTYNAEFIKCVTTTHQTIVNMLSNKWTSVNYTNNTTSITKQLNYGSAIEVSMYQCYSIFKSMEEIKNKCQYDNCDYNKCVLDTIKIELDSNNNTKK